MMGRGVGGGGEGEEWGWRGQEWGRVWGGSGVKETYMRTNKRENMVRKGYIYIYYK